jgi:undecaprenyl-diphosphatase
MDGLDQSITRSINQLAGSDAMVDYAVLAITTFGVPLMVAAVALQWWRAAERPRIRHAIVAAGISFLIGLGFNQLVLLAVQRPRPYLDGLTHLIIAPSADGSFPSDHATAAAAIAATFLLHGMKGRGVVYSGAALLVCLSRVYVGTHYISDVLAGALIGAASALLVRRAYRRGTKLDQFVTGIL